MNEAWSLLPATPFNKGALSAAFEERGCQNLRDAARLVQELPYGRTSKPTEHQSVLEEGRGTCSSKHALVALLAEELGIDVQLTLSCFEMNDANTPGVGEVLSRHGLDSILEAHCYLLFNNKPVDLTWAIPVKNGSIAYHHEMPVAPAQLAAQKHGYHRLKLDAWRDKLNLDVPTERLWEIREQCIAALQRSPRRT